MRKKKRNEELKPYPQGAQEETGREPEQAAGEAESRRMMLVYAGPAYFAKKAAESRKKEAEQDQQVTDAMMMGVYAGPGFFEGRPEGILMQKEDLAEKEKQEESKDREENVNGGPAYNQEMPEYVPMDAVKTDPDTPKVQEGLDFFCPVCGAKVVLGAKFCPECGTSLKSLWAETDENIRDGCEIGGADGSMDGESVNV